MTARKGRSAHPAAFELVERPMPEPGPREVRIYRHTPKGFGMTATSEVFMTSEGDNYFRPDDICAAPDGGLYVPETFPHFVPGHFDGATELPRRRQAARRRTSAVL